MTFILRDNQDWNKMVKEASLKLAQPVSPAMPAPAGAPAKPAPPAGREMEEGMPVAPGRKPLPDQPAGGMKGQPGEYLQKEHKDLESARAIVMQMWGLLTGEAGEGGYDEVESLMKAIKAMEEFIQVEETGVKPGKTKGRSKESFVIRVAGKLKERLTPIYDNLVTQKEELLGRELNEEEQIKLWQEASKILSKMLKDMAPPADEPVPMEGGPAMQEGPSLPPGAEVEQHPGGWEAPGVDRDGGLF